jgi:hypothetical protein
VEKFYFKPGAERNRLAQISNNISGGEFIILPEGK